MRPIKALLDHYPTTVTVISMAALFVSFWMQYQPTRSSTFVESFAHKQIQEELGNHDYLRFEPNVVMNTGHKNKYIVSGQATAIQIGQYEPDRIPTTRYQKITYALLIAVTCSNNLGECMEVKKMQIRNASTKTPLM